MAPAATKRPNFPLQSQQNCGERRREQRNRESANGLAWPEQRPSVDEDRSAVERAVEAGGDSAFLASTGAPLATASKITSCATNADA